MELHFLFHLRQIIEKKRTLPKSFDKIHTDSKTFQGQYKELEVRGCSQGHTFLHDKSRIEFKFDNFQSNFLHNKENHTIMKSASHC